MVWVVRGQCRLLRAPAVPKPVSFASGSCGAATATSPTTSGNIGEIGKSLCVPATLAAHTVKAAGGYHASGSFYANTGLELLARHTAMPIAFYDVEDVDAMLSAMDQARGPQLAT